MGLFACDVCEVVENTATAGLYGYHCRRMKPSAQEVAERPQLAELTGDGKARCSACNPERGEWHGMFPRQTWDGERPVVNRVSGTAEISADGHYRYRLTRQWGYGNKTALWVMLNPSTADATTPDATIRRCIAFSKREHHERLVVVNLYALRTRYPRILLEDSEPIGPENDRWIIDEARQAERIILAWGAKRIQGERAPAVTRMLQLAQVPMECLGTTKGGHPRHPLYLPADTALEPYAI